MLTCHDMERRLADAAGGELPAEERAAFEAHLAGCEQCRCEYESLMQTVRAMRELPGPRRMALRRAGDRLLLEEVAPTAPSGQMVRGGRVLRYAAGLFIAFTAGYLTHGWLALSVRHDRADPIRHVGEVAPGRAAEPVPFSVRGALARAHMRDPDRSDLAKCLTVLSD